MIVVHFYFQPWCHGGWLHFSHFKEVNFKIYSWWMIVMHFSHFKEVNFKTFPMVDDCNAFLVIPKKLFSKKDGQSFCFFLFWIFEPLESLNLPSLLTFQSAEYGKSALEVHLDDSKSRTWNREWFFVDIFPAPALNKISPQIWLP